MPTAGLFVAFVIKSPAINQRDVKMVVPGESTSRVTPVRPPSHFIPPSLLPVLSSFFRSFGTQKYVYYSSQFMDDKLRCDFVISCVLVVVSVLLSLVSVWSPTLTLYPPRTDFDIIPFCLLLPALRSFVRARELLASYLVSSRLVSSRLALRTTPLPQAVGVRSIHSASR